MKSYDGEVLADVKVLGCNIVVVDYVIEVILIAVLQ
jgi:hypothetical protein